MRKKSMKVLSLALCAGLMASNFNNTKVSAWGGSAHESMTAQIDNSTTLMKKASSYSDKKFPSNDINKALHGYQDYVGTLRYIYTVAVERKQGTSLETAINSPFPSHEKLSSVHKQAVKTAIRSICDSELNNETRTPKNDADKILGLALHLAGDIYAHRTMVPMNAVENNRFSKSDKALFEDWDNVEALIKAGDLQFYQITGHLIKSSTAGFEDNIEFYSSRYSVGTKYLTTKLVEGYNNNKTFSQYWIARAGDGSDYKMRLSNIDLY